LYPGRNRMSKEEKIETIEENVDSILEEELYLELEKAQAAERKPTFTQFTRKGLEEILQGDGK